MKKTLQLLVLFLTLLAPTAALKADHMMGADMSYVCLGNGKYRVTGKIYRQCSGIPLNSPSGSAYGGNNGNQSCGSTSLAFTRVSIKDITPRCSSQSSPCSPQNQMSSEGIEEHTYQVTVDISKAPYSTWLANGCCEINFAIGQCCRDVKITTLSGYYDFWSNCMLNICNVNKSSNKCNTSPQFSNSAAGYVCCNQTFYFNNGAVDTIDYDSFAYKLVPGLLSLPNGTVTYKSPYSARYPMKPYCIPTTSVSCAPNPNAKPTRGFFLDTTTGDMVFTPTKCDEVGVIVLEISEYRKDTTGAWVIVGKTRRDMEFFVKDDCGYNNAPKVEGPTSNKVCEGDQICITIKGTDETFTPNQTIPDTVTMTWNRGIPGATFTIKDPKAREKEAEFCWKTKVGMARDVAYSFTVTADDNHCPKPSAATRGFRVKVNPRAFSTRKYDILKCGRFAFSAKEAVGFKGNPSYKWSVRDSNKREIKFSVKKLDTMLMPHGGRFYVVHTVNNSDNCPTSYIDTVDYPWPPKVDLATRDTYACYGTTSVLIPRIAHAKSPFKYYWTRPFTHTSGDTNSVLSIAGINRDSTIMVRITDGDGCVFYDTATIFVKPLPVVSLGPDVRICTYETASFDAQNADTVKYSWNSGDTTRMITKHVDGNYIVTITDTTWFCQQKDTVYLHVNDTAISLAGNDQKICTRLEATLNASHSPIAQSATYQWTNLSTNTNLGTSTQIKVKPTNSNGDGNPAVTYNYELYTKVTQGGHTCEDKDTVQILVNTLPKVVMPNLPARCYDYGDIELQNVNGMIPAKNLRTSANFTISGRRLPGSIPNKAGVSSVIEASPVDRFIFRTTNVDNANLQGSVDYREKVYLIFTDTNSCKQIDSSRTQIIYGNPIIEFLPASFCQDLGEFDIDRIIKRPKPNPSILNWGFNTLTKTGATVNLPTRIIDKNGGFGSADDWFTFGTPSEDLYQGLYTVEYCVQNKLTTCRNCDTMSITIKGEPVITPNQPPRICVSDTAVNMLQFFQVDGGPATLNPGDSLYIAAYVNGNLSNPSFALSNLKYFNPTGRPGTWRFMYRTSSSGCVKFDSIEMEVNDLPRFTITPTKFVCSSDPVINLNNEISIPSPVPGGGSVSWTGPSAFVAGNSFTPGRSGTTTTSGPHQVIGTYTDPKGCKRKDTLAVTVRNAPTLAITSPKPAQACENSPLSITSTNAWSNGIQWSTIQGSDGSINNAADTNITYTHGSTDATNRYAWLKLVTLPLGTEVCPMLTDSIQLIIHPYPAVTFTRPYKGCVPVTADFNATESKGIAASSLTWAWTFGNGDVSALEDPTGIVYATQGRYPVRLTVINTAGNCRVDLDSPNFVEAYPIPVASFSTNPANTTIALPNFKMINQSTLDGSIFTNGFMNYLWNFGTGNPQDTSTLANPRFAYGKDTATYQISLTVISDKGCVNTTTRSVFIGPDIIVYIPDVFTPDGAGPQRNNTFKLAIENEKTFSMQIFNRWGELLYVATDKNKGWDGMANGQMCADGVYVYHVEITSLEDKVYKFDGTITLMR